MKQAPSFSLLRGWKGLSPCLDKATRKFPVIANSQYSVLLSVKINSLKTKRRLLYLKTQFVPRSKHFSSRL